MEGEFIKFRFVRRGKQVLLPINQPQIVSLFEKNKKFVPPHAPPFPPREITKGNRNFSWRTNAAVITWEEGGGGRRENWKRTLREKQKNRDFLRGKQRTLPLSCSAIRFDTKFHSNIFRIWPLFPSCCKCRFAVQTWNVLFSFLSFSATMKRRTNRSHPAWELFFAVYFSGKQQCVLHTHRVDRYTRMGG